MNKTEKKIYENSFHSYTDDTIKPYVYLKRSRNNSQYSQQTIHIRILFFFFAKPMSDAKEKTKKHKRDQEGKQKKKKTKAIKMKKIDKSDQRRQRKRAIMKI